MSTWERESGVECVVAPCCGFTFDAVHTDADGGYSCPACAEIALTKQVDAAREVVEAAREGFWCVVADAQDRMSVEAQRRLKAALAAFDAAGDAR